ncbi:hypothetical protein SRHO_G00089410 [Serrasalmus rhombeus]
MLGRAQAGTEESVVLSAHHCPAACWHHHFNPRRPLSVLFETRAVAEHPVVPEVELAEGWCQPLPTGCPL